MAGQANSLISHGSLVGTIKTSNAATNSLVGRLNVDNTITGRMDTSSLVGALDTDNVITSQSGSISTDDQIVGVLNANNTIAGGVGTAYNPAYALVDEAAAQIVLYINNTDYKFYAELKDKNGSHIANSNIIDLPLESMVVNGSYDSTNKEIVLTLNNGNTLRFSVADLVSGLVSTTDLSTVLLNYVEFTDYANGTNAGVIKTSSSYATETSDGVLRAQNKTYAQYESLSNNAFIGKGTLDNAIAGKELTNKTYVDNADKVFEDDLFNSGYVTSEGTSMSLDVKTGKPEIELKGNTTQSGTPTPDSPQPINVVSGRQDITTCGKNLFNSAIQEGTYNTAVYTIDEDGKINQSATDSSNWNANQKRNFKLSAGTYTLRIFGKTSNQNLQIRNITDSTDIITTKNDIVTFTLNSEKTIALKTWGSSGYPVSYYIELEKREITDPNYEAYKGQNYEINLGKNLLNVIDTTATSNDITLISSNGEITLNGTASANTSMIVFNNFFYLEAGTYTVSLNNSSSISGSNYFRVLDENYNAVSNAIYFSTANNTLTFTLSTGKKCRCQIRTASGTEYNNYVIKPQLEKGNSASSFSSYKTSIELCKIGTYQDRIYKENGTWYIEKQIGKIVLDGSENDWRYSTGNQVHYTDEIRNIAKANTTYYCNYYTKVDNTTTYVNMINGTTKYDGIDNCRLIFKNTSITTANDFKTWLSTHNTIVYYILATPTTTEIIDSELISQLESIELLEGLNNVLMSSSGDLPGIIKIKAFSNTTAGSITRLEKIVEFLGDSIGDIGTLLDEIQGEVI